MASTSQMPSTSKLLKRAENGQALVAAALDNDNKAIQQLMKHVDLDINAKKDNQTAVFVCASRNNVEGLQLLCSEVGLEHGIDVNLANNQGNTPFQIACANDAAGAVEFLLKLPMWFQLDVNKCCAFGRSPFFMACHNNCLKTLRLLTSPHAVNLEPVRGRLEFQGLDGLMHISGFMVAALKGHTKAVQLLMDSIVVPINQDDLLLPVKLNSSGKLIEVTPAEKLSATYPLLEQCFRAGCTAPAKSWCANCKNRRYCSPECQKLEWTKHKPICKLRCVHRPSPKTILDVK